jgi:hypothetical protein
MSSTRTRLSSVCAVIAAFISFDASAQVRTYDNPQHEGFAVSYCGADPASCGEYMAMAWCLSIGYEYASDWAARGRSGDPVRSIRLDDGAVCEGPACETFARITCGPEARTFTTPVLGPAGKLTLLSADRRTVEHSIDASQSQLLVPGCSQHEPGVFVCGSMDEYQHCRTLMISRMIHSCHADLAFADVVARPVAVAASAFELAVESDAIVRVQPGVRGRGQIKGDASLEVSFATPVAAEGRECLERTSYVYWPTGPDGGTAELGKADDCDAPIELRVTAHRDDLLRAYDLCETFAAWGFEIEDSIDVLVAGLFRFGSSGQPSGDVQAPYSEVSAPLTIACGI